MMSEPTITQTWNDKKSFHQLENSLSKLIASGNTNSYMGWMIGITLQYEDLIITYKNRLAYWKDQKENRKANRFMLKAF